jgi:hypothetical protein
MIVLLGGQNGHFVGGGDVAQRKLHRKTVHLRFRQRVGAPKLDRVLRRDHKKQIRQVSSLAIDADLVLAHRFQQRRLRSRRGPVDFVRQQDVRENRPFMKMKLLVALAVNGDADDVGWQQVGRELHALERGGDRFGQRFGQCGFAGAGEILQQHVAAAGQRGQKQAGGGGLPLHDAGDIGGNFGVDFPRGCAVDLAGREFLESGSRG